MTDTDKIAQERESFEAWIRTDRPLASLERDADGDYVKFPIEMGWESWKARAVLDTGGRDDIILRMRERIASVREDHRRKMNAASDRAEMAASVGDMKEVSINSTESERYREAFVALNVAIDIIDSIEFPAAAPQPPASASEPLGRFGHHSDPAIDFCVEVEEIEGEAENLRIGFEKGTPARDDLAKRIGLALEFRVGGDECAVRAKNRLREIEAKFRASTSASAGKEPVAWVNKSYLDSIIEHSGKVYWHAPMMCGTWFAGAFPIYTAPPAQPVAVSVKPLEWGAERQCDDGQAAQDAMTPIGTYVATDNGWFLTGRTGYEREDSMDASKAAAQADYEQRIRSALVIEPAPDARQAAEKMREACAGAVRAWITRPNDCEECGGVAPETGVYYECALETRGRDCICNAQVDAAEEIMRRIRALPISGDKER